MLRVGERTPTVVAGSLPQTPGVPLARWSRSELARWVAAAPQLPPVSASTIGRWLKAERLRPWRYHGGPHIQNPQTFLERAGPILRLYGQAVALLKEGTWLVCAYRENLSASARSGTGSTGSHPRASGTAIAALPSSWDAAPDCRALRR